MPRGQRLRNLKGRRRAQTDVEQREVDVALSQHSHALLRSHRNPHLRHAGFLEDVRRIERDHHVVLDQKSASRQTTQKRPVGCIELHVPCFDHCDLRHPGVPRHSVPTLENAGDGLHRLHSPVSYSCRCHLT